LHGAIGAIFASVEKFPDLIKPAVHDMSGLIQDQMDILTGDISKRIEIKPDVAMPRGIPLDPEAEATHKKEGKVSTMHDALMAIQEAMGGKGNMQARQLKAGEMTVAELKKLNARPHRLADGAAGPPWQAAGAP
jgi:hypothetical protein